MMVKIDLIYPKLDKDYNGLISGYSIFPPPSGLEIIASYIQEKISGSRIKIWDYSLFDKPSINDLSGEVIGISDWFSNHNNSIKIAQEIKEKNKNCKIVFGGPNASNLNKRILNNHSYIDYVVEGDGEEALLGIINLLNGKESSSNVPNLWYRNSLGETLFTYHKNVNLNSLPRWNFKHLVKSNLEEYDSRKKDYNEDLDRTPIPLSSIRGCLKASKLGKCSYCNIPLRGVRTIKPEKFWNQIQYLNKIYGIKSFFETGDDIVIGNYPAKLLQKKPNDLEVSFRGYASPDSITRDIAKVLSNIGVNELFLGIENINREILAKANKFYDVSKIEGSIKNCEDNGIRLFLPFLFGLPGETKETADKNHEFSHRISQKYLNINRILYSLAVPIIGSSWFESLAKDKELVKKYPQILTTDNLDYSILTEYSIRQNCNVSLDYLISLIDNPPVFEKNKIASYGDFANKIKGNKNE